MNPLYWPQPDCCILLLESRNMIQQVSNQKFYIETNRCIVVYLSDALWDLWDRSTVSHTPQCIWQIPHNAPVCNKCAQMLVFQHLLRHCSKSIMSSCWRKDCDYPGMLRHCVTFLITKVTLNIQGQPYIPRVHLSEVSLVRSSLRWLCSAETVVRKHSHSQLVSPFVCVPGSTPLLARKEPDRRSKNPNTHTQKVQVTVSESPIFRSSSSPKFVIYRRFHIPKGPPLDGFYVTKFL